MSQIPYTHQYDGCLKIIAVVGGALVGLLPAAICDWLIMGILGYDSSIRYLISIPLFLICWWTLVFFVIWKFSYITDYLYLRLSLRIPISVEESKRYSFLLWPNETGQWLPLTKIKSFPKHQRKQVLHEIACSVSEEVNRKKR